MTDDHRRVVLCHLGLAMRHAVGSGRAALLSVSEGSQFGRTDFGEFDVDGRFQLCDRHRIRALIGKVQGGRGFPRDRKREGDHLWTTQYSTKAKRMDFK